MITFKTQKQSSDLAGDFLRNDFNQATRHEHSLLVGQLDRLQRLVEKLHQTNLGESEIPVKVDGRLVYRDRVNGEEDEIADDILGLPQQQQQSEAAVMGPPVDVQIPSEDQLRRGIEALRLNRRLQRTFNQRISKQANAKSIPSSRRNDTKMQDDSQRRRQNLLAKRDAG